MRSHLMAGVMFWMWRLGAALVQHLPTGLVYAGAVIGGEITYLGWATKREIAKHNLAIVLGRAQTDIEVARVARKSFRNFAKYLTEIMRFPKIPPAAFSACADRPNIRWCGWQGPSSLRRRGAGRGKWGVVSVVSVPSATIRIGRVGGSLRRTADRRRRRA